MSRWPFPTSPGLSPRVRGNQGRPLCHLPRRGSIPARAGEPALSMVISSLLEVYPRACGGTQFVAGPRQFAHGLSPRVRGNRRPSSAAPCPGRSIPARAGEPTCACPAPPPVAVYPRACGGTSTIQECEADLGGLSPRVRGNLQNGGAVDDRLGSIPARAGEPPSPASDQPTPGVYPRACGGTRRSSRRRRWGSGLSPRVRGNPLLPGFPTFKKGSIPARAGEPADQEVQHRLDGVYPRACGGTCRCLDLLDGEHGLSPRVRGNHLWQYIRGHCPRSIPARAGEPDPGEGEIGAAAVYPRACGGTRRRAGGRRHVEGLSPRVRGNLQQAGGHQRHLRSIPARAGEPRCSRSARPPGSVYPRACGGTSRILRTTGKMQGLSPRVRGNRRPRPGRASGGRSIPARAGEPIAQRPPSATDTVYPRACGGTAGSEYNDGSARGLSPRVRGNREQANRLYVIVRSIPARAGEPICIIAGRPRDRVYPRACGGTEGTFVALFTLAGLSPRVRGNPGATALPCAPRGSIPARAGEPASRSASNCCRRVYPRACGGTLHVMTKTRLREGLSPRVRGNPGCC